MKEICIAIGSGNKFNQYLVQLLNTQSTCKYVDSEFPENCEEKGSVLCEGIYCCFGNDWTCKPKKDSTFEEICVHVGQGALINFLKLNCVRYASLVRAEKCGTVEDADARCVCICVGTGKQDELCAENVPELICCISEKCACGLKQNPKDQGACVCISAGK